MTRRAKSARLACALLAAFCASSARAARADEAPAALGAEDAPQAKDVNAPPAPAEAPTCAAPEPDPNLRVELQLGFGVGSKRFERPLEDGSVQRLPESAFGALELGLRVRLPERGRASLDGALRYRSSLGFRVEQSPLFALRSAQDVRVQRLELSARGALRLRDDARAPVIGLDFGVLLSSFVPELHDRLAPKYALAGPILRPFGRLYPLDWLQLQLGPELGYVALVDGSLAEGGVGEQGFSLGAEASARARLLPALSLVLAAQSALVLVGSGGGRTDFEDVERALTLGLVGAL